MIQKNQISKKRYGELIDEILLCQKALEKRFDVYVANTVSRLIEARIELALSTVEPEPKHTETHGREFYEEIGRRGGERVRKLIEAGKEPEKTLHKETTTEG